MSTRNPHVRFSYNSFIKNLAAADIEVSSAQALYPKTNAVLDIRTKPWKAAGNFEITASNLNIYINDGSPKTVALTVGSYTYATLAAHIQTRLNAASSLWTCTYDFVGGTYKFTIGHTGSATLRFSQVTNAAWFDLGYVGSVDDVNTTWPADEQRNHTSEWIQFDMGGSRDCGFLAVVGDANASFPLSATAIVRIQADDVNNNWGSPQLSLDMTVSDTGVFQFLDDLPDADFRFWRLVYIDQTNPLGPEGISIGYVHIGDYVTFTNTNINQGFDKAIIDASESVQSTNGQRYFTKFPKLKKFSSATLSYLLTNERYALEQLYFNVGVTTPFFISFDPLLNVSDDNDDLTCFVRFTNDLQMNNVFARYFSVSIELEESL